MKRVFAAVLLICMLSGCFFACGGKDKTPDISAGRLVNGILKTGGYASPDCLTVMGEEEYELQYEAYYSISRDLIRDGALAYASGFCADEISLLVVKDQGDAEKAKQALLDHAERQYQVYVKYDSAEADKLKNAKTVTYGTYVFLVVSSDADEILETIGKLIKDPESVPAFSPITSTETETVTETETNPPDPVYDYSSPVPESQPMDQAEWEKRTVLIGDSRLYGLVYYLGLEPYRNLSRESLTINGVFSTKLKDEGNKTVAELLRESPDFDRCYLMFGINELSWANSSSFRGYYEKVIELVRSVNPDAQIYLMAIYPVEEQAVKNYKDVFTNANIRAVNATLQTLAEQQQVYYLDSFAALEENGGLPAGSANGDGIHVGPSACRKLLAYMLSHTVAR